MEIAVQERTSDVTLGPVLFNWSPERWRDFYFRIADEAPVATVYLGEAICAKRAPLFAPFLAEVTARLKASGKTVVFPTLAQVMSKQDRKQVDAVCCRANGRGRGQRCLRAVALTRTAASHRAVHERL